MGTRNVHFGEALEQYRLGFDIVSITSLVDRVPSHTLQPFVTAKRLDRAQQRALRRPPLTTLCIVQFAPSPEGPLHVRSIADGARTLYAFLAKEALSVTALVTPAEQEIRPFFTTSTLN
jgi:hypothetical protein